MFQPNIDRTERQRRFPVTIKGTRDGLAFVLDDSASFEEILIDLRQKLTGEHSQLFSGMNMPVYLVLGSRLLSHDEEDAIRDLIGLRENLLLRPIEMTNKWRNKPDHPAKIHYGTIRSGIRMENLGDLVIIGDVNPGGQVVAAGDVIVMGALRGMAHAGCLGDDTCIIAAVWLSPTQLRIADVISRPPDGQAITQEVLGMEFAYLKDGQISVDKMMRLPQTRDSIEKGAMQKWEKQ